MGEWLYLGWHHAAIIEQLLALGAWRTLRSAQGERPVDIARRRDRPDSAVILEPDLRSPSPTTVLPPIQRNFHLLIRERAARLIDEQALRLPELEPLLALLEGRFWFPVPGMYGGFRYWLDRLADAPVLLAENWSRVVGGSGQLHAVSSHGYLLITEVSSEVEVRPCGSLRRGSGMRQLGSFAPE
jgi:hypothetical protein